MNKDYDLYLIDVANDFKETVFRNMHHYKTNRKWIIRLLNTFHSKKFESAIRRLMNNNGEIEELVLSRILTLADYELELINDNLKPNEGFNIRKELSEDEKKIFYLHFAIKVLSALFVTHGFYRGVEDTDELIIKTYRYLIEKLDCKELYDKLVEKTKEEVDEFEEVVVLYNLVDSFQSFYGLFNPYKEDIVEQFMRIYPPFRVKNYKNTVYNIYNKTYAVYKAIGKYKWNLKSDLSYLGLQDEAEHLLDNLMLLHFEDYSLNEIVQAMVYYYDGDRDEDLSNVLFEKFREKYGYVGKVYHGSKDMSENIPTMEKMVKRYKSGSISSSKDIKQAMEFSKYYRNSMEDDTNITYGFISEIEITEDMYAIDIEKIMLDLKEKLPEITGWISDSLLKEREVLILAEYVPQGKILSYAEAEKIANKE